MAVPVSKSSDTAQTKGKAARTEHAVPTEDTMTPKGTLLILFVYAGLLIALWGYTYVAMLLRR